MSSYRGILAYISYCWIHYEAWLVTVITTGHKGYMYSFCCSHILKLDYSGCKGL